MTSNSKLRIVHCFFNPVGIRFRRIYDTIVEQSRLGYDVGYICNKQKPDSDSEEFLNQLDDFCTLGSTRISMSPKPSLRDFGAIRLTRRFAQSVDANILHGHGAKGGAYARFAAGKMNKLGNQISVFYSPHAIASHVSRLSFNGFLFLALERRLAGLTHGIIFDSYYSAETYSKKIDELHCQYRIIPNGLNPEDFKEREFDTQVADFVFFGDLTKTSGADTLIKAINGVTVQTPVTAVIVGEGPEKRICLSFRKTWH